MMIKNVHLLNGRQITKDGIHLMFNKYFEKLFTLAISQSNSKYVFRILRITGIPRFFKILKQKKTVTILLFNNKEQKTADIIFTYIVNNYNIISLKDFIKALENGDCGKLPPYAIIITFDDGFKNNYNLFEIIKKYCIPVTIFLCSSIIDTNRHYWFKDQKLESFENFKLVKMTNFDRLENLEREGFIQTKEYSNRQALSLAEINIMKNFVDFQSHTMFHPCLPKCSYIEAKNEIFESKTQLENILKKQIVAISYPFGDYSEREIELCKQSGYKCGITVDYGFNTIFTNPFKLKRLNVNDTDNLDEFIVKSSGLWAFLKTMNRKSKNIFMFENFKKH
jgi:peptidoglycan/xylan/chitin deacetylase (PgdA/CDA1 family)